MELIEDDATVEKLSEKLYKSQTKETAEVAFALRGPRNALRVLGRGETDTRNEQLVQIVFYL